MIQEFTVLHLFSGIGGAALGFQQTAEEYKGMAARFRTLAGIDVDSDACADFWTLTGAPAVEMDLAKGEWALGSTGIWVTPMSREIDWRDYTQNPVIGCEERG